MVKKIKGKSLMLRVENSTIALATSCSVTTTTVTSESRTKDDAVGPNASFEYVDWSMSSDNIVGSNDDVTAQKLYDDLLELQLAGTVVNVSAELMSSTTGAVPKGDWQPDTAENNAFKPYGGEAYINDIQLNAPAEGDATLSVSFKANGPLRKLTNTQL